MAMIDGNTKAQDETAQEISQMRSELAKGKHDPENYKCN